MPFNCVNIKFISPEAFLENQLILLIASIVNKKLAFFTPQLAFINTS